MKRFPALVLLLALAAPLARAPLCEMASHDHEESHEHMAHMASVSDAEHASDCHLLMGCQLAVDGASNQALDVRTEAAPPLDRAATVVETPFDWRLTPEAPPPKQL